MPIHVSVVCDEEGCDRVQRGGFEGDDETFGDLKVALREWGWTFEGNKLRCPRCNGRDFPEQKEEQ